jgi:predicted DNA-binding transcriptional regulator YafY
MPERGASSLARRIVAAAVAKQVVEIDSTLKPGVGVSSRRRIEPYAVLEHAGAWYVAARDPRANAAKPSGSIACLRRTTLPQERFRPVSKWSPEAFLGAMSRRSLESGGPKAKVRFFGAGVRCDRRNAPPGTVKRSGGAAVWTTSFDDPKGFAAFLLGSGVPFEVLEPKALARDVRVAASSAARLHDGPPTLPAQ